MWRHGARRTTDVGMMLSSPLRLRAGWRKRNIGEKGRLILGVPLTPMMSPRLRPAWTSAKAPVEASCVLSKGEMQSYDNIVAYSAVAIT